MGEERLILPPRWCYQMVVDCDPVRGWTVRPCKQPVYRVLGPKEAVCFDHSPNAKRPTPEGR